VAGGRGSHLAAHTAADHSRAKRVQPLSGQLRISTIGRPDAADGDLVSKSADPG
jgi:hypothetical protein